MPTPIPASPEILVNSHISNHQSRPDITALANGQYVVVWQSKYQDGSDYGVYGQVFNADGTKSGSEFRVNTHTSLEQEDPRVVATENGFMVVWESEGEDGDGYGVYHRIYYTTGSAPSGAIKINDLTDGMQWNPDLSDGAGNPMAVWVSDSEGQLLTLMVSVLDLNGNGRVDVPIGTVSNIFTTPKAAQLSATQYVVLYDGKLRLFDATTGTAGPEIAVGSAADAEITVLADGRFVVTWTASGVSGGDAQDVVARIFAADGTAEGDAFLVNSHVAGTQASPDITALSDGGFIVAWGSDGQDGSGFGVFAQRFDANGAAIGDAFQVNSFTTGHQVQVEVTELANGDVVFTWVSDGQDGSLSGVYSRVFDMPPGPPHDRLEGTGDAELISGRAGEDTILGFGGDDTLRGGHDDDLILGGGGADKIFGGIGDDVARGGGGHDVMRGQGGEDLLEGNVGNDRLIGGAGDDTLIGGAGNDRLYGNAGLDVFVFDSGDGQDTIFKFEDGLDLIEIRSGAASFDDLQITQSGRHVLVAFDDVVLKIMREDAANLTGDDFIF